MRTDCSAGVFSFGWRVQAVLVPITLILAAACSTAAQPARTQTPADVVARVGSTTITLADVDRVALQEMTGSFGNVKLSQAIYEARRAVLDDLVGNALLDQEAKARGSDRDALVQQEITSKVSPPSDAEVEAWYRANQARVQGATLDQVRAPIRELLLRDRAAAAHEAFIGQLRAKSQVAIMLDAPRQVVKAANAPVRGSASAPIEIIEFSDFQCPFCRRADATVRQVLDTYGDRVRLVYRHFPLPNHPNARPAAEASACAAEQGKFWQFHDRLFSVASTKLADADLKQDAADLGLDTSRFNACFDGHKYKALVDADLKDGEEAGVTGTPAFFINGRMINGAMPFDAFKRIIDDELAAHQ